MWKKNNGVLLFNVYIFFNENVNMPKVNLKLLKYNMHIGTACVCMNILYHKHF